ncbi:12796_t:CDS:2 [Funneliformis geosporum]|uniref:12796_t:CDS:1 n=1 Tax=Funneliformis geosporum TaxID=1117311 RepID=A0A9W4SNS2_9GLOM|nr:12796_t:CDS:2 [Funneliformis geosporum]
MTDDDCLSPKKKELRSFAYSQITQLPVYPALFSCEEFVKAALFSCEEIVKAGNDGPVSIQLFFPVKKSLKRVMIDRWSLKFNQVILEGHYTELSEIVKVGNDGPVVFEVSFRGHYTELYGIKGLHFILPALL